MTPSRIRVAVNGYGVIGKRVADAVAAQDDMQVAGVVDVASDWRPAMAVRRGMPLFGASAEHAAALAPGTRAELTIARAGRQSLVPVELGRRPAPQRKADSSHRPG